MVHHFSPEITQFWLRPSFFSLAYIKLLNYVMWNEDPMVWYISDWSEFDTASLKFMISGRKLSKINNVTRWILIIICNCSLDNHLKNSITMLI